MTPSGMTAGATKSGASLVTRTLIVKFLSEVRGLKNNKCPDIARDFGSYSRRGHGCIMKYSGFSPTVGQKNGRSDRKRNFDVIRSATKTPRHKDYSEIFGSIPKRDLMI
jgi:hypothetical protein